MAEALTLHQLNAVVNALDAARVNHNIRTDYSGLGMHPNDRCLAVVTDEPEKVIAVLRELEDGTGLPTPLLGSLGRRSVLYWPDFVVEAE